MNCHLFSLLQGYAHVRITLTAHEESPLETSAMYSGTNTIILPSTFLITPFVQFFAYI